MTGAERLAAALTRHPRAPLAPLPTPLQELPRFSEAIGARVLLKRDDIGSPGLAGNKVRKLEFLVGAAREEGVDALVTLGAAQSNSCRAAAATAAALGWRCRLVLGGPAAPDGPPTGNLLLDRLLGAEVVHAGTDDWAAIAARAEEEATALREEGATPLLLPAGCSTPLGAVGFTAAWAELRAQLEALGERPAEVVHATSSGGTVAGLLAGRAIAGEDDAPAVRAVLVADDLHDAMAGFYAWLANEAATLLGHPLELGAADVPLDTSELGEGYGVPTPQALEAMALLARTEGVLCDPVYSGKALAAVVAGAREGRYADAPVVLWHTGGWHVLFDPHHGDPVLAATTAAP